MDIWEDEYYLFRSFIITRIDEVPAKNLKEISEKYQEALKKADEIGEKFHFIYNVIEKTAIDQDVFSKSEMVALQEYLSCAKTIDEYQRFEIYKLGYHDCITWMKMIGIL